MNKLSAEQRAYVARERAKDKNVRHLARILASARPRSDALPPPSHDVHAPSNLACSGAQTVR
jgi:hypothetical protein